MVTVKVWGKPVHKPETGVAIKLPDTAAAVPFNPVKGAIVPVPLAAAPIRTFEFVQLTVAATGFVVVKFIAAVLVVSQTVWLVTGDRTGVGLTVMLKFCGIPIHKPMDGVATKLPVAATPVPFVAPVNEAIFPAPDAAAPITAFEFVQLITVPATGLTA